MKNKKMAIMIAGVIGIFIFGIGYLLGDFKEDSQDKASKSLDKDHKKKKDFAEPIDLAGYWVADKNQIFKVNKTSNKYTINTGYQLKYSYSYRDGKISSQDTTFSKIEAGTDKDKFTGIWQGETQATSTVKYITKVMINKENGLYVHKICISGDENWADNDWDKAIYIKSKDKLNFYATYKATKDYIWDKKTGALKNSFDKYIYGKKSNQSIMLPTNTTAKRGDLKIYKHYTKVD